MSESISNPVFDEAARLYAQYLPVVEEMEKAFEHAVDIFLMDIHKAIEGLSAPLVMHEEPHGQYQSWWLADGKSASDDAPVPYLWFKRRKAEIVIPGQLEVTIDVEKGKMRVGPQIENAIRGIKLPEYCYQLSKGLEGGVATYVISYGKSPKPVQDVAKILTEFLKTIVPLKF